jgi:hypothetical protein
MSDDSPFPPDKRGTNPRSLANLRPSKKGDQPRNQYGINGRERSTRVVDFLERADNTELGRKLIEKLGLPADVPRIDALLQREVIAGLSKSDSARKNLIEQYAGKPKMQVDLSSEDGTMSPLGPDSVADALRVAIEERRKLKEKPPEEPAKQEAPGDDTAGAK